jgi:hypothetical protein
MIWVSVYVCMCVCIYGVEVFIILSGCLSTENLTFDLYNFFALKMLSFHYFLTRDEKKKVRRRGTTTTSKVAYGG